MPEVVTLPTKEAFIAGGAKASEYAAFITKATLDAVNAGKSVAIGEVAPAAPKPFDPNAPYVCPPKYKGTFTYQIPTRHYRMGIMYEPGDLVTLTDDEPGPGWVDVASLPAVALAPPEAAVPHGRAADRSV